MQSEIPIVAMLFNGDMFFQHRLEIGNSSTKTRTFFEDHIFIMQGEIAIGQPRDSFRGLDAAPMTVLPLVTMCFPLITPPTCTYMDRINLHCVVVRIYVSHTRGNDKYSGS